MTSFVLLNDMKAEASWALLGLTCRLAQSLGLHRTQPIDGRRTPDAARKENARRKLWYEANPFRHCHGFTANSFQVDMCVARHAYFLVF